MKKDRKLNFLCAALAVILVFVGGVCIFDRLSKNQDVVEKLTFAAAAFVMPDGSTGGEEKIAAPDKAQDENTEVNIVSENQTVHEEIEPYDVSQHDDEIHYPVIESNYREGNTACENFYIKDAMGIGTDFSYYLKRPLGFEVKKDKTVQVLIVHTHTTESYLPYDEGYYHESFYSRNEDESKNMVGVGEKIAKSLEAKGIGVVHAKEVHDSPEYTGAYDRSYNTIMKYMEQYPDISVVLDIHRDSIASSSDNAKVKPTFEADGKKAAQIMIMSGCDAYDEYGFPHWEDNLSFALKIQKTAEDMYPGMTRPLYFGSFAYNMPVSKGSLLIEVGTDVNTISEAQYTGELLGNVVAKVLQSEE